MFERITQIKQLESTQEWDVIIIGGGATGLGTALDSTTRGYKTLLLEQVDFAKGTSSRSTKLVHGGVRYLAQGNIDLVKEALYERGLLLKNAPHLVRKQSFIIPNYRVWDSVLYTIGLKVYDLLAGKLSFGKSQRISKKETSNRLQTIKDEKLKGGIVYYDGQFDDARLAINLAQTCIEEEATVLNYFKVNEILKDDNGNVNGVLVKDIENDINYRVKAKCVINATGVFADTILQMDDNRVHNMIQPSQGVHLVLDKSFLPGNDALMIPKTDDGRVMFLLPWHNRVIIGTTDTLIDSFSLEPKALEKEVEFIIDTANKYLKKPVQHKDILSKFAGLRPLAAPKDNATKSKEISRSHKIIVSKSGLITITGGKWTTYRRMAKDTLNKVINLGMLPKAKCQTKNLKIHGANNEMDNSNHLSIYGSDKILIEQIIQTNPLLGEKLHKRLEFTKAEVVWAVRNEMARTVEDVLARRIRVLFLDAKAAIEIAPKVAAIMANELGKNNEWEAEQISSFNKISKGYII